MDISQEMMSAVSDGKLEIVENLVEKYGVNYCSRWHKGYALLQIALIAQHTNIAHFLLASGAKVNCKKLMFSDTPLHYACCDGDLNTVQLLLEKGAYVESKNEYNKTPLFIAVENCNMKIIELLVKFNANINARDNEDESLLHIAVKRGSFKLANFLVNCGARVNTKDITGLVPLHLAAQKGNLKIVQLLLDNNGTIHSQCSVRGKRGYTPIYFAIENGHADVVNLLLTYGYFDTRAEDGRTPLHVAAMKDFDGIAHNLINNGACVEAKTVVNAYTPLHFATELGHFNVVQLLLQQGSQVDTKARDDLTSLHIAAQKGCVDIAQVLLNNGASVHAVSLEHGFTPLHYASAIGCTELVKLLISSGSEVNALSKSKLTPLHVAIENQHDLLVLSLLDCGAWVDTQDNKGRTALQIAAEKRSFKLVEEILRFSPNLEVPGNHNALIFTLLDCQTGWKMHAQVLLNYGFTLNCNDILVPGLLLATIEKGCVNIVKDLLAFGADPNNSVQYKHNCSMFTPLYCAVVNNNVDIVNALISYGATVNYSCDGIQTPLHCAATNGFLDILKILIDAGASINAKNKDGCTPLHSAILNVPDNLKYLAHPRHADVSSDRLANLRSAIDRCYKTCDILLKSNAAVNLKDLKSNTALYLAVSQGLFGVVKLLLEYGANVAITNESNDSPFECVMRTLKENSADHLRFLFGIIRDLMRRRRPFGSITLPYSYKKTALALTRHVIIRKYSNSDIGEHIFKLMDSRNEIKVLRNKCEEEMVHLVNTKFPNNLNSYADVLFLNVNSLAVLFGNSGVVAKLQSKVHSVTFPEYGDLIEKKFERGFHRFQLVSEASSCMPALFANLPELPGECLEHILVFLRNDDLSRLIIACPNPV